MIKRVFFNLIQSSLNNSLPIEGKRKVNSFHPINTHLRNYVPVSILILRKIIKQNNFGNEVIFMMFDS